MFGLKGDVTSNVFHLDDNTIIYPAGNFIVVYSIDSKTQSLIPCSPVSAPFKKPCPRALACPCH